MNAEDVNVEKMPKWAGERYLPVAATEIIGAETHYEHLHHYEFASQFVSGKKVLDLAFGEGYGSFLLSRDADIVVGIEIDLQAVVLAENRYATENIKFIQGSVLNIPIDEEKAFDVIICFKTIKSVEDQKKLLAEVKRLLKDDGLFIVSIPNKQSNTEDSNYHNPFHLKEIYFEEFDRILQNHFKYICFFGNVVYTGSSIWSLIDHATYCNEPSFEINNKSFYLKTPDKKIQLDIVAIASKSSKKINLIKNRCSNDKAHELELKVIERDLRINELDGLLRISNERVHELNYAISNMERSIVWQLLMKYQLGIVERALPHGTRRRKNYDLVLSGGRILINDGWSSFYKSFINPDSTQHRINAGQSEKKVSSSEEGNEQPENELLVHIHKVPLEIIYIETQIWLKKGNNLIRFHVQEGGDRPCDIPEMKSVDRRCLSLGVGDISICDGTTKLPMNWGGNWHGIEDSNGSAFRWLSNDATIIVDSNEDCNAILVLQTHSFYRPRKLNIYAKSVQTKCKFRKDAGKKFMLLKGIECLADKNVVKKELDEIIERLSGKI